MLHPANAQEQNLINCISILLAMLLSPSPSPTFTATAGDGKVALKWVTESEVENLGFNIYRSQNPNKQFRLNGTK